MEFDILEKHIFCVTNSGANFLKTYKHFPLTETEIAASTGPVTNNNDLDQPYHEDDMEFHHLNDILVPTLEDDEQLSQEQLIYNFQLIGSMPHTYCIRWPRMILTRWKAK